MVFEGYKITLEHFMVDTTSGERVRLEQPLYGQNIFVAQTQSQKVYALNEAFERMRQEALNRMHDTLDEVNE